MGQYLRHKMEYYRGSAGLLRFYRTWLMLLAIFTILTMTWKMTTQGYDNHIYFLMDLLVGGFAVIGSLSFLPCDRSTVFGNIAFLFVFMGVKAYKTFHFLNTQVGSGSLPEMDMMTDSMGGAMGGMGSAVSAMNMGAAGGGMFMDGGMGAVAAPISPDMGLLGQLVQKFLSGPLKQQGDFSKFIIVTECELFAVLCGIFIVMLVTQWQFYKTPLAQLRERG